VKGIRVAKILIKNLKKYFMLFSPSIIYSLVLIIEYKSSTQHWNLKSPQIFL